MDYIEQIERDGRPANVHAERVVLGRMMSYEPKEWPLLEENVLQVSMDLFSLTSHQQIFEAIWHVSREKILPDLVTVSRWLESKVALQAVGGQSYIASLYENVPRNFDITNYVGILREDHQRRALLETVESYAAAAIDPTTAPKESIQNALHKLETLLEEDERAVVEPIGIYLAKQDKEAAIQNLSRVGGLQLGFAELDRLIGGLQGGDLMVVAARPSVGKTAWACNVAHHVAVVLGKTPAFYTMEQKKDQIIGRMLSASTRIESDHIKGGRLSELERSLVASYLQRIADSNLFLIDTPKLTLTDIRAQTRRVKRLYGLDLIIIDQLSKMSRRDIREKNMPKHEQVGEQTTGLKHLAQELDVPIIVLNQLTRLSTKNKDARPTLSDLKESGSIEEDADLVLFLHRPDYHDREDESLKGKAEQILEKNREGKTGTVKGTYNAGIQRWIDPTELQPKQQSLPRDDYWSRSENVPYPYDR